MTKGRGLFDQLEAGLDGFTAAERSIASYILGNRSTIPFETATSLADKLQISAVTVGRFCRNLGYRHFRALKEDLRNDISGVPWLVGDKLAAFSTDELGHSVELEIAGLLEVYALAQTPEWQAVVKLLTDSKRIHVAGFQTEHGIAAMLAHTLQYIRDEVFLVSNETGNYADVLLGPGKGRTLVVCETRRYSEHALRLTQEAVERGRAVVILTDKYCEWASRFTPHVISVPTDVGLFWDSSVSFACVVNLLLNGVVSRLGGAVENRMIEYSTLYQAFTGHVRPAGRLRKSGYRSRK